MSWILAILWQFAFHEMHNSCIFKKPSFWQVFWYMTWYGKNMRKKYRRRQVLWVDALIQLPRKTGERNHIYISVEVYFVRISMRIVFSLKINSRSTLHIFFFQQVVVRFFVYKWRRWKPIRELKLTQIWRRIFFLQEVMPQ